jgi:hypothetical protein
VRSPAAPASRTSWPPRPFANSARGELELAVGVAGQVALQLQLLLDPLQRPDVVEGAPAEGPLDRVLVDVVQRSAGVVLAEGSLQVVEVGELLQR